MITISISSAPSLIESVISLFLVVYEDNITNGFGAEIVSLVNEHCFEMLDAPVKRVASKDSPIPYASDLENRVLVQTSWIKEAVKQSINY